MAQDILWQDPPEDAVKGGSRNTKWGSVAKSLKVNAKRFGLVSVKPNRTAAVALANAIAGGRRDEFAPAGDFESRYAEQSDGSFQIFARYLGEAVAASPSDVDDDGGVDPFDDDSAE
jgi:hypothetical protein